MTGYFNMASDTDASKSTFNDVQGGQKNITNNIRENTKTYNHILHADRTNVNSTNTTNVNHTNVNHNQTHSPIAKVITHYLGQLGNVPIVTPEQTVPDSPGSNHAGNDHQETDQDEDSLRVLGSEIGEILHQEPTEQRSSQTSADSHPGTAEGQSLKLPQNASPQQKPLGKTDPLVDQNLSSKEVEENVITHGYRQGDKIPVSDWLNWCIRFDEKLEKIQPSIVNNSMINTENTNNTKNANNNTNNNSNTKNSTANNTNYNNLNINDSLNPARIRLQRPPYRGSHSDMRRNLSSSDLDAIDETHQQANILVLGATRSGKSTFINQLSGEDFGVSNALGTCTNAIQVSQPFTLDGLQVRLIDTPGFDMSHGLDVLNMIAIHLEYEYKYGRMLNGVIYMHDITKRRMERDDMKNLRMLMSLCGENAFGNVVFVTNMWKDNCPEEYEFREKELASNEKFFKPVLDRGADSVRHNNTLVSGQAIVRKIIGKTSRPLRIQRELADHLNNISQTTAGGNLIRESNELIAQYEQDVRMLKHGITDAIRLGNQNTRRELEDELKNAGRLLNKLRREKENIVKTYGKAKADYWGNKQTRALREARDRAIHPQRFPRTRSLPNGNDSEQGDPGQSGDDKTIYLHPECVKSTPPI